jgi:hypothetical protein
MVISRGQPDALLEGLAALQCKVEADDRSTLVVLPDESRSFLFERIGGWVHLGSTLITAEDLAESKHALLLPLFLLSLQHRCLGCRFSLDSDGFLAIGADVYPSNQQPDSLLRIMRQVDFVGDVVLPLCERVLHSGEMPLESEIDQAFDKRGQ